MDQYAKTETQRLKYIRENQATLRADLYNGLNDYIHAGEEHVYDVESPVSRMGRHIILAPSFTGGERYMREQYQDAMAIVRKMGKPDLFMAVTCNPNWAEITEYLLPGQVPSDRPDLVVRVFFGN